MLFFAFPHYLNWSACSFTNKTKRDNSIWLFIFDAVSTAKTSCSVTNIEPSFSLDWNKLKPVIITQNNEFKYIYIYFMTRIVKPKQFSPRLICFVDKPNRTKDSLGLVDTQFTQEFRFRSSFLSEGATPWHVILRRDHSLRKMFTNWTVIGIHSNLMKKNTLVII